MIAELAWRGAFAEGAEISWSVVASQFVPSGRPSVPTLAGQAAVAVALLRRILRAPAPKAKTEPRPKKDRPRPSSGRTVRIKA